MKTTRTEALEILATYEGLLSQYNNAEGADHILAAIAKWEAVLAALGDA